jgi:hypothetical protein
MEPGTDRASGENGKLCLRTAARYAPLGAHCEAVYVSCYQVTHFANGAPLLKSDGRVFAP